MKRKYANIILVIILIIALIVLWITYFDTETFSNNTTTENKNINNNKNIDSNTDGNIDGNIGDIKLCKGSVDESKLVNICSLNTDEKPCCGNSLNSFYCNHSVTKICKDEYNNCILGNGNGNGEKKGNKDEMESKESIKDIYDVKNIKIKCGEQLKNCCKPYDDIKYNSNPLNTQPIFTKILNANQTTDILTNIILPSNEKTTPFNECGKLCQTDFKCKAFDYTDGGLCRLFNKYNPILPGLGKGLGKEIQLKTDSNSNSNSNTGYFKKI